MQDDPGLLSSSLSVLRLIGGWACCGLGLLNLAMGVGAGDGPYVLFHAVLLVTGIALMALGALRRRPRRMAYAVGAVLAVLGPVLTALPPTGPARHGFPFTALAGGSGGWHLAVFHTIADLFFWACAGFLALLLVTLLRPAREATPQPPRPSHPTHAEQRAPAAADENVGGLP